MLRTFSASLLIGFLLSCSISAADPIYKSDDIVKFFERSADLGPARGICLGTADECNDEKPASNGFDMLINFDLDSAELNEQARTNLDEFAKALKDNRLRTATFLVEGHTDASGSDVHNEHLSEMRARSVAAFLFRSGIESTRVEAVGKGEKAPRTSDPYDPANRRVEMRMKLN